MTEGSTQSPVSQPVSVKEFFERVPPGRITPIKDLAGRISVSGTLAPSYQFLLPELELHCETKSCNGIRFFEPLERGYLQPGEIKEYFVSYKCRNCKKTIKTYAVWASLNEDRVQGNLFKFGENPPFGPPTPAKVITILGAEKEYYLKGRRAENQGLGIAAFAYYRRVVENQKNKILDEIIRVSEKIGASKEILGDLNAAKKETQFNRVVAALRHGIPPALLINGHNPLTLLHSALSEGLHAQTDEECLELATSIRIVLTELVDRLANALKEEAELKSAVSRLLKTNIERTKEKDS